MDPKFVSPTCGNGRRWLLAGPISQEHDAFTVNGLGMNPAEFGKLAASHNLVEIVEACRREEDVGTVVGIRNCYGRR